MALCPHCQNNLPEGAADSAPTVAGTWAFPPPPLPLRTRRLHHRRCPRHLPPPLLRRPPRRPVGERRLRPQASRPGAVVPESPGTTGIASAWRAP